jgi:DNA repair protein RadD
MLRPHQSATVQATMDAWRNGCMRPLNVLCVAAGKSLSIAELCRLNCERGERTVILVHRPELAKQIKAACDMLGVPCGINAAKLGERTWRAPVIVAMINSVYTNAHSFGIVSNILIDECHMIPFAFSGMYREFLRGFPHARIAGFTGTPFRMQGGSLIEGEAALFERIVFTYDIVDGIRDGYLVPGFSAPALDQVDVTGLKKVGGEYTGASQDAQMLALMDSHVAQMKTGAADRKSWLIFEASQKAALAMGERLNAWGIPAGVVIDKTKNREAIIDAFNAGRLRALVNVDTLTTGFDSQRIDLICMRRKTMSLGLYIQMVGRGLRTIGGNIEKSIAAGKSDCVFYDFASNISTHGPLDFIRPKDTKSKLVSCESCRARNSVAAVKCWNCDEPIHKLCPACLVNIPKGTLDCPECGHDMRVGGGDAAPKPQKLLETPSGAALIAAFRPVSEKAGGWIPIRKTWEQDGAAVALDNNGDRWELPEALRAHAVDARWIRGEAGAVAGLLKLNGASRTTVLQVTVSGAVLPVPMPPSM